MQPSLFLSHGTPWLAVKENSYTEFLKEYVSKHERPSAIVMISSQWSSNEQAVSAVKKHGVSYDFTGCPNEVYTITYPAVGNLELSDRILTLLSKIGVFGEFDDCRLLDYGGWLPLKLMYPNADIPVVALSINPTLPFKRQYDIGKALMSLKEENILIIASGGLVHNIDYIQYEMSVVEGWAIHFIEWVEDKILKWDLEALFQFDQNAPFALDAVPHIEEFIPLIIAMGTGDYKRKPKSLHRSFQFGNISLSVLEFA